MFTSTAKQQQEARQVSKEEPCPLCGGEYRCFLLSDDCVICGGVDIAPNGWKRVKASKDGRNIFSRGSTKRSKQKAKTLSKPKVELPSPNEVLPLVIYPQSDSPQWVTLTTVGGESEIQIEYLYPDPLTGEPLGKVVRRQWTDRRPDYKDKAGKLHDKLIQPWHWTEPYHPNQGDRGWWSDRGKGLKSWPLYRESEVAEDIVATGGDSVVFYIAGEQAVETARQIGLLSLTNQGGEGSYQKQVVEFLTANKPKLFIIWPDNDKTGRSSSARLLNACLAAGVPSILIEPTNIWSEIPEKGDIKDVVKDSGMGVPELIRRIEEEIHRALNAGNGGGVSGDDGGDDGNNQRPSDPNLVDGITIEAHILDSLFESGTGRTRTIEDSFFVDTGLEYWKRVPDKPILKAITHQLKHSYRLLHKGEQIFKDFPFFTDAKKKSSFLICRDALDVGEIPANNHLRCFTNCTIDLRTGLSIPHDPKHFLTTAIAAEYQPNQECPEVFLDFIKSAYGEDMIQVIRAYTSMLLDPTAPYGKFIHLIGPSGSGKGTLLRLWGEMFGNDHFRSGEFSNLSTPEGRHQYLTGTALYAVPDVGGYVQGLKPFYELVDNGPMSGRALFSSIAYQKLWNCRFVIASVDHLQIENSGDGWDRRCLPLPTLARSGIEDPLLGSKLASVKGQIISWALAMPREERDRIILHPSTNERVLALKQDAAIHGDPVRAFVDGCLRPAGNATATLESHQLHSWFSVFCQEHGYQGWGMNKFINHLKTILHNQYVPRRRATTTEDASRGMIPAHWSGITDLAGVFVNLVNLKQSSDSSYQYQPARQFEPQWLCVKSKCQEGGLMAFKTNSPTPPDGSGGSQFPSANSTSPDPHETTQHQAFQENGSGRSSRSGGEGLPVTPFTETAQESIKNVEESNLASPTPLLDLLDPKPENPADTGLNADQEIKNGGDDLPDLPDLPGDVNPRKEDIAAFVVTPQPQQPETLTLFATDNDAWLSEECLQDIAANLENCLDSETLADLRQCWPSHALKAACKRLKPEIRQRIKKWTVEQNTRLHSEDALPVQDQQIPATTEFKVGDRVAHVDEYTPMSTYHGTVKAVFSDEVLVRWEEWRGRPKECERYHVSELRKLE